MKRKKQGKLWAILLSLSMIFSISGVTAFAQGNSGSFTINSGEKSVTVSSTNSDVLGDGTISYDAESNTLTLKNATMSNDYPSNPVIYAPNSKSLTIEVQGENTITASQAIFVTGDLTITGNGTLTVNGTTYAVYSAGNLVISGANVKANTTGTHGAGIHVNGSISIKDSDVVQSTSSGVWGMYGDKGISISDSVVTAASTSSNYYSGMFSSSGNITIESSTVVASSANDAGIMTNGDITITNSDVDATTEFPGGDDFGIFAIGGNNVSISGGTVKATATGKYANAIYASEGTLSISNGAEVYAKAESASAYPALYGTNGVTISNSTIDAESSGDAGIFSPVAVTITNGSDVKASGHWPAIRGNEGVEISGSSVNAVSNNDIAIFSPTNVRIENSAVDAAGKDGMEGILSSGTTSVSGSWISTTGDETFENNISNSALINKENGRVIGNLTLPGDVTVPEGTTLNFTDGSSLIIPENICFTNNGTITGKIDIQNSGQITCTNHTGGAASCTAQAICDVCSQPYGETLHHSTVLTEKVEATCTTNGKEAYYTCKNCKKNFSDAEGKNEIVALDEYGIIPATGHSKTHVGAKAPTATEPGNIEYWYCPQCDTYFKDAGLTEVITKEQTVLAPTGEAEPSKPEESTPDKPDSDSPQTGDSSNLFIWVAVMFMAGAGMAGTIVSSRKRKHSR